MDIDTFSEKMRRKAKEIKLDLNNDEILKFYEYMNLLLEWNKKINLTSIVEPNEVIEKHFIDSLTINQYLNNKKNLLDIGTGAGFPAIPLKILNKNMEFTLVDSLNKRIIFLQEVSKKLDKIKCIHARAEELAQDGRYREKYDIVTSRAVAKLNVLLEYMMPFVKNGGICVCMKGPNITEEMEEAKKAIEILGGKVEKQDNIILPDSTIERNIIVIKKIKETPQKYPRKAGIPTKNPII